MEFGERISLYRRNRNFTQEELAARIGVTSQAVSKWERKQSYPDVSMLPEICRLLQVSADALLGIEKNSFSEKDDRLTGDEIMRNLRTRENPLELMFGTGLVEAVVKTPYVAYIEDRRKDLSAKGILMPLVRIRDESALDGREWMITAYNRVLFDERIEEMPEDLGAYMAEKLAEIVEENYGYILNRDLVCAIVENLRIAYPVLIDGIVPEKISYGLLHNVMSGLWERGHNPVFYMIKTIEKMESCLRLKPDMTDEELTIAVAADIEREDNYFKYTETKNGTV